MFSYLSKVRFPATEVDDAPDANMQLNATWEKEMFLLFEFWCANVNLTKRITVSVVSVYHSQTDSKNKCLPCGRKWMNNAIIFC